MLRQVFPITILQLRSAARLALSSIEDGTSGHGDLLKAEGDEEDTRFAIVFAAMGVNMETAHFFKQVCLVGCLPALLQTMANIKHNMLFVAEQIKGCSHTQSLAPTKKLVNKGYGRSGSVRWGARRILLSIMRAGCKETTL